MILNSVSGIVGEDQERPSSLDDAYIDPGPWRNISLENRSALETAASSFLECLVWVAVIRRRKKTPHEPGLFSRVVLPSRLRVYRNILARKPGKKYSMTDWRIICPLCFAENLAASDAEMSCVACGHTSPSTNGVWQLLTCDRMDHYRDFLENYTKVRIAEGRGTYNAATLRALPDCPESHRLAGQWNIRAISFACLLRLLKDRLKPHDKVLDLGAGTGWLCHRLALNGFSPCAIDLSADIHDGLGAAGNFDTDWPRLQAEYDRIPIGDGAVNAVIYNASFHYCVNQERSLREALRVIAPGGMLVILDSPIYRAASAGEQMIEEQQQYFVRLIDKRSDALPSTGFLTWRRLKALSDEFNLAWRFERPWYGIRWALRPVMAKLRGRREPATFAIAWTYKASSDSRE